MIPVGVSGDKGERGIDRRNPERPDMLGFLSGLKAGRFVTPRRSASVLDDGFSAGRGKSEEPLGGDNNRELAEEGGEGEPRSGEPVSDDSAGVESMSEELLGGEYTRLGGEP